MKIKEGELQMMFSNPFYCLSKILSMLTVKHEPLVTEEVWIKECSNLIKKMGAKKILNILLGSLKGYNPTDFSKDIKLEGKNESELQDIFCNPFYCLPEIDHNFTIEHEIMVTEEVWVDAADKCIKEIGAENFLNNLLENLKGNYI